MLKNKKLIYDRDMNVKFEFIQNFNQTYELGKTLGSGSYGIVKKARLKKSSEIFACKIVNRKEDYLREVDHLIQCRDCKGVLQLQRVSFTKDKMLMQFPLAISFSKFLDEKIFESLHSHLEYCLKNCIYLLKTICEIHSVGIVHRDINPNNIVLLNKERPYLIDFGFSKRIGNLEEIPKKYNITTPCYRAPELYNLTGNNCYGPLIDEWSIGCILIECFSGYSPFENQDQNIIKKKIASFIWWRTGIKNKQSGKKSFNILEKLKHIYDNFVKYEEIKNIKECNIMFDGLIRMIIFLLEPFAKDRLSAKKILKIIEIKTPIVIKNPLKISGNLNMKEFKNNLLQYYDICDKLGNISPRLFYHAIELYKLCLGKKFYYFI